MASKTYAKAAAEAPKERIESLPTDRPIAVYYRQSSEGQIGNESTSMQQEDLPQQLIEMGWSAKDIIVIADDQAVSGTLDIHERIGMSRLTDLIRERQIGAVAIVSENRAFRDQYQDQAAIFARSCAENGVIVIVPNGNVPIYRFHDPAQGDFHRQLFIQAAKDGFNFIKQHIKGKMHTARKRKALRGLWASGGSIPLGYMVDLATRKFVVFEPVAVVIRAWFALFLQYKGNVTAAARHIQEQGPYLPNLDDPALYAALPKNADGTAKYRLAKHIAMPKRNGHYYVSKMGLPGLLTNVAYIGHCTVTEWEHFIGPRGGKAKRAIKTTVLKDNHDPIIEEDVFQAAFNYLSKTSVDGEPNVDYKERHTTRPRNTSDQRRASVPRPFCDGVLYSPDTRGDLQSVIANWRAELGQYEYTAISHDGKVQPVKLWTKTADQADAVVHDILTYTAAGEKQPTIAQALANRAQQDNTDFEAERKHWQDMIRLAEKELLRKKTLWERSADEPDLVNEAVAGYKKVKANIAKYQAELARIDALEADQNRRAELSAQIFKLTGDYSELSLEDKRLVLELCVERVEAHKQGIDLKITVVFRGGETESRTIGLHGEGAWTAEQCEKLTQLVEENAPGLLIAATYPDRTWRSIVSKYRRLTGACLSTSDPIRNDETFIAFAQRQWPEEADPWLGRLKTEGLDALRSKWRFENKIAARWLGMVLALADLEDQDDDDEETQVIKEALRNAAQTLKSDDSTSGTLRSRL